MSEKGFHVLSEFLRSGRKEDMRLQDEDGEGALHWERGTRWTKLNSGGGRRGKHSAGTCGSPKQAEIQQGQLQKGELFRVLNLKESSMHFKRTDLEQLQHCTNLPLRVTLPAHTEQGKTGPGLG